jgi:hypothetical protein
MITTMKRGNSLSELYLDWLQAAKENLEVAKLLHEYENYRFAVFHLQQAGEITSKAILMRVNLLVISEENELVKDIRKDLKLPALSSIKWGHAWHFKLLDVMDGFVDKSDKLTEYILQNNIQENSVTPYLADFRDNVPDYKEKIKTARTTKSDSNPSIDELNTTIEFCHKRLNVTFKVARNLEDKLANFKMPDKKRLIRKTENALEIKVDERTSQAIDKVLALDIVDYAQQTTIFSQTLIILAIVNSYLLPHESQTRYPLGQIGFPYNSDMPLVQRIRDFRDIIRRGIWVGLGQNGVYRYNTDVLTTIPHNRFNETLSF